MIGRQISHYKILEKLGEGGMGVVYKAEDLKLRRPVALKFLTPQTLVSKHNKTRFVTEAQAVAALDHQNICTIYEIDESGGQPFIAMGYIEGQTLKEKIKSGPLKLEEALDIAIQAGEGLKEAHSKGIIHRDIKSANIMIAKSGQVKIMDFGLAKLVMGRTQITKTGTTVGTVAYMSPEQTQGQEVDHRTDIWSLGVVLYEMLTGQLPFKSDYKQTVVYLILNEEPKPVSSFRSDVSPMLDQLISRTLAKDVAQRYSSAAELLENMKLLKARPALPGSSSDAEGNSVAVIDFNNLARDSEVDWLSGGIAETVTVDLKRISKLKVVSRENIVKALGQTVDRQVTEEDVLNLGKKFRTRWIIWGGYQKVGNSIRITAQFTEGITGNLVGTAKVDGIMDDIFKMQDQIITSWVETLQLKLTSAELKKIEKPETIKVQAYECHAKGRRLFYQFEKASFDKAQEFFEKAIELDPQYALAYSGLGSIHIFRFIGQTESRDLDFGVNYLQKAMQLDPDLVDPYRWLTYAYTRQQHFDDAVRAGLKAIELEPDDFWSHYFLGVAYNIKAFMQYETVWFADAIRALSRGISLEPNLHAGYAALAANLIHNGDYAAAKSHLEKAITIEETGKSAGTRFFGALLWRGQLAFREHDLDAATEYYNRSLALLKAVEHMYTKLINAHTYLGLGNINFTRCLYHETLDDYNKAHDIITKNPKALGMGYLLVRVRIGMAKAFYRLGTNKEDNKKYQEAVELFTSKQGYDFSWFPEGTDAQVLFDMAGYHSLSNRKQEALTHLRRAIECGWRDIPFLESDECLDGIRSEPEYQRIVQELKSGKRLL